MTTQFAAWPHFDADEINAVQRVLESGKVNYWTGQQGREFEKAFAEYHGCQYGIGVANGTLALELALKALEMKPQDEVIVPSRTFIATASSVVACGGVPRVADVDLVSQNITVETIQQALTPNTRGIIVVHLAGWPCDMDAIMAFARAHNLFVIEDCSQAHGATYKGQSVGSFGDIAAFSCCQDKIITTGGEGGVVITSNYCLWQRAWSYKDHGKNPEKIVASNSSGTFRWLHDSFGSNYRLTEMQAAIGLLQLKKLPIWVDRRRHLAGIFNQRLSNVSGLRLTLPDDNINHAYYKYYVFVEPEQLVSGWTRDKLLQHLKQQGIPAFSGSCSEIYLEQAFEAYRPQQRLPQAKQLGETSLMFMVHPTLSDDNIDFMCDGLVNLMARATTEEVTICAE